MEILKVGAAEYRKNLSYYVGKCNEGSIVVVYNNKLPSAVSLSYDLFREIVGIDLGRGSKKHKVQKE